jgi:thiol:disulfide interchange protein DsbA
VWNQQTAIYARVYYALEALPQFNELHHELFEVFESFGHEMTLGDQLKNIYEYVATKGIDSDQFKQTVEGKGLEDKLKNSIALAKHYEITGTPTLIISGAMKVNNKALTAKDDLLVYVDKLLEL